ncbi:MAG: hypothetical protein V1752_06985 [Candidatus Firestonebacteria bacterium]
MDNKKKYSLLILAFGLLIGFVLAFWFIPENRYIPKNNKAGLGTSRLGEEYRYNIEEYKQVDSERVLYTALPGFKTGFDEATGIIVDQNDKIYVCGDKGIRIVDIEGTLLEEIKGEDKLTAVEITREGIIYAAARDKVFFGGKDLFKKSFGKKGRKTGEFEYITSIKIMRGNLFIADAGNRRVSKYDLNGKYLGEFVKKDSKKGYKGFIIPSPHMDLGPDKDGSLWVANTGMLRLEKYSAEGVFLDSWGKSGVKPENFIGCCNPCNFTVTKDGDFVTSEKGLPRIKLYDKTGKFLGIAAPPSVFDEKCVNMALAVDSKDRIYALDSVEKKVRVFVKTTKGNKR